MLKVMGIMSNDDPGAEEIIGAYELVFPQASRDVIEKELKLSFNDLIIVVQGSLQLWFWEKTASRESSDPYYDLFEDWDLIVSSFLSQYG